MPKGKNFIKDICRALGHNFPDNVSCDRCGLCVAGVYVDGLLQHPKYDYNILGANTVKFHVTPHVGSHVTILAYADGLNHRSDFTVERKDPKDPSSIPTSFSFEPLLYSRRS